MSVNPTIKLYFSSFSIHWPCDGKQPTTAVCHWGSWSDRCLFYRAEVSSLSNDPNWNHSDAMWCNNPQKNPPFRYFMMKNYSTRYSLRLQIQALKAYWMPKLTAAFASNPLKCLHYGSLPTKFRDIFLRRRVLLLAQKLEGNHYIDC